MTLDPLDVNNEGKRAWHLGVLGQGLPATAGTLHVTAQVPPFLISNRFHVEHSMDAIMWFE